MFRPFKAISAVLITSAISLATVGMAFAEAPEPISAESSAAEEQYLTIDRSWLQLSILDKPFGEEYHLRKEWEEEDRRYIGYATDYEDYDTTGVYVILQYAMGSENEVEDTISRSQEPKNSGDTVFDYLGTIQAKSGQDMTKRDGFPFLTKKM